MHLALLALVLQLRTPALSESVQRVAERPVAGDSVKDLTRARNAQASFERSRRANLPFSGGSAGRCDVRLGRFCWWYDESTPKFPPEAEIIGRRRAELIAELDTLSARYPGDAWLTGMRVYYRIDGRALASADSAVRSCGATAWWCSALAGFVAHARGESARADSAFATALDFMPHEKACAWRDIRFLLSGDDRDAYEHRSCEDRRFLEARYWLLSRPQLASAANEWLNEFNARRVIVWLSERGATPHLLRWGDDATELVMRYGWPTAWSRIQMSSVGATDPSTVGHDPSPSFAFAPVTKFADSLTVLSPGDWQLKATRAESRYAPRLVARVADVAAQIARFRRGDSTLVVAAFVAADDSLRSPLAMVAATTAHGLPAMSAPDTVRAGIARVTIRGTVSLAGVEVMDTATHLLARIRLGYVPTADSARLTLSDLLVYRAGEAPASSLDSALVRAVRGDTVSRNRPIGLFWETYGLAAGGEAVDVAVSVERVDHSWIRSTKQRLGLTPEDTPIRIRWTDARASADHGAAHAISLDLVNLDSGRYRVTLRLTPDGGTPVTSTREIELLDR